MSSLGRIPAGPGGAANLRARIAQSSANSDADHLRTATLIGASLRAWETLCMPRLARGCDGSLTPVYGTPWIRCVCPNCGVCAGCVRTQAAKWQPADSARFPRRAAYRPARAAPDGKGASIPETLRNSGRSGVNRQILSPNSLPVGQPKLGVLAARRSRAREAREAAMPQFRTGLSRWSLWRRTQGRYMRETHVRSLTQEDNESRT